MEIKQIKELMAAMERTGTKKVSLKKEEFELTIERDGVPTRGVSMQVMTGEDYDENPMRSDIEQHRSTASPARALEKPKSKEPEAEPTNAIFVTSPMVGTYYSAPSPDDPAFVKVGDRISKDTVVCIIEAMKVMNEVKAGVSGIVAELLVDSGHPVEFGSKLFRVTPAEGS